MPASPADVPDMPHPLVLVPTEFERAVIRPRLTGREACQIELCGFGLVAAAARTASLIARAKPSRVILVGIAGSLDEETLVGHALRFAAVACDGIGAGSGGGFIPAAAMGWTQWPGDPPDATTAVGDVITMRCGPGDDPDALLLTVGAAAATEADVDRRRGLFPNARAEDMEGFAVAAACRMHGVPVDIVRGISNVAGDRDASRWRVDEALEAAATRALGLLAEGA